MKSGVGDNDEHHRLTAVQGLAALSLDALSSVAYGPEAILVVLVAAGATALHYRLRYRLEQIAPSAAASSAASAAAAPASTEASPPPG